MSMILTFGIAGLFYLTKPYKKIETEIKYKITYVMFT